MPRRRCSSCLLFDSSNLLPHSAQTTVVVVMVVTDQILEQFVARSGKLLGTTRVRGRATRSEVETAALAVPDLTTTVLTLTLTGLSADSVLGSGKRTPPWRRIASVVAMLAGAAVGAVLVLDVSVWAALGLAAGSLALVALAPSAIGRDRLAE